MFIMHIHSGYLLKQDCPLFELLILSFALIFIFKNIHCNGGLSTEALMRCENSGDLPAA